MKPGIHPTGYRPVVFHDVAIDKRWMMMSTVQTDQTTVWEDGRTYPIYKVEMSMYSHPLYTGSQRILDTDGRVEVVPAARYTPFGVGSFIVPGISVSVPLSWRLEQLELRVKPALELHFGFATMSVALELDAAGRAEPRFWCGFALSL